MTDLLRKIIVLARRKMIHAMQTIQKKSHLPNSAIAIARKGWSHY
jgi:hypothetical protein